MKSTFFSDFKKFIAKGNILDMAVGVVIGGAFGKIVSSLVADIITPLISLLTGKVNLAELYAVMKYPEGVTAADALPATAAEAKAAGYAILTYGSFLQSVIDFLLIALSVFTMLRIIIKSKEKMESLRKKEEEEAPAEEAPAEPTVEEKTLETLNEIKVLLEKGGK